MKELKLALIGFGNAGQAFAKMLLEKEEELEKRYDTRIVVVAITTKTRGNLVDAWGIDLDKALKNVQNSGRFDKILGFSENSTSQGIVDKVEYDVLVELTPLEFNSGKIATNHIRGALRRGKHAITGNKGPVAWAFKELTELAEKNNCRFLYETTVMDGMPLFNMKRDTLRLCKVTEIRGIINRTTNYILCEMAKGRSRAEILAEGKKRGFIESNPATDLDGFDAAAKVAVLANTLMGANLTPPDIERKGIKDITMEDLEKAQENGNAIKLMCHAYIDENGQVKGSVGPEEVSKNDIYATIEGTSSVITITTDMMGTLTLIEEASEVKQSAYGLFADLMSLIEQD
ncbi:hypothetical protein LI177_14365 [bacterium 210820-DFI.6.37]|nr:hypothetical protein [bacterium 210820-DFI.6.37]